MNSKSYTLLFILVCLLSNAASSPCVLLARTFFVDDYGATPNDNTIDTDAIEKTFGDACSYSQKQLDNHNGDLSGCVMDSTSYSNSDIHSRYKASSTFDINNRPLTEFFPSVLLLARIVFSHKGSYLWSRQIGFPSCHYVRVEGNHSTWVHTDRGNQGNFITWNGHTHITIGDITVDYAPSAPTHTGGVITKTTPDFIELTVSPPHSCAVDVAARVIYPMDLTTDPDNAFPSGAYGGFYWVYPQPTSRELYYNGQWAHSMKRVDTSSGCVLRIQNPPNTDFSDKSRFPQLQVGTNLSVSSWQIIAFAGSTADPILYHSIFMTGGPANSILGRDQSTLLINVTMTRKPGYWAGIGSANGLGLQRKALILINNTFDSAEDDWINQAAGYQTLATVSDKTHISLLGRRMTEGVEGFFKPYDYIYVAKPDGGLGFTPYAKLQLQSVAYDRDYRFVNFTLSAKTPLPSQAGIGDIVWNANFSLNLVAIGNTVKNSRGNGLLVKGDNMLIKDNTFLNLAYCGVSTGTDQTYWFESTPSHNVAIVNNRFIRTAIWDSNAHAIGVNAFAYDKTVHSPNEPFPPPGAVQINPPKGFSNIHIRNNYIEVDYRSYNNLPIRMEEGVIYVASTDTLDITDNTFVVHSKLSNDMSLIDLCNVKNAVVSNNRLAADAGWTVELNKTAQADRATYTRNGGASFSVKLYNVDVCSGCQLNITSRTVFKETSFVN